MTCSMCDGSGYIADGDEAIPCDAGDCPYWAARKVGTTARKMAIDHRFTHLGKGPEWWQALIDQEYRRKADTAPGRAA
jgi:hypothetical protein